MESPEELVSPWALKEGPPTVTNKAQEVGVT